LFGETELSLGLCEEEKEKMNLKKRTKDEQITYLQNKIIELVASRIDKQKLQEAIDKVLFEKHHYYDIKLLLKELNTELKKELGLEC